jgi:single-stranded DNA-binding protein
MIDGLIAGKIHGAPVARMSRDGKHQFVTGKLRCAGGDGETLFVDIVAFSDSAKACLLELSDGDSAALCGSLTVSVWQPSGGGPKPQVRLNVTGALTPYHVKKRRAVMQSGHARSASDDGTRTASQDNGEFHDDPLDGAF